MNIRTETNLNTCRDLWEQMIPQEKIYDLWETRDCFQRYFRRDPLFIVAQDGGRPVGLIPLSYVPEYDYYGYFPGEVWKGRTWLEQNRLIAPNRQVLDAMFAWMDQKKIRRHLRYLIDSPLYPKEDASVNIDEIGYLFLPPVYDFQMAKYHETFSRKSYKTIKKEIEALYARQLQFRLDDDHDFDLLIEMSVSRFGASSYFADDRFTQGFKALRDLLKAKGWLKMVTVLMEGEVAAVDIGSVFNGAYTLVGGGTNGGFPGVAKVINLFHMQRACDEKYLEADFLCGDFSWKKIFHLTPRPLFVISNIDTSILPPDK